MIDWLVDLSRLNSGVPIQGALGAYAPPDRKIRKFFMRRPNFSVIYAYICCQQTDVVFEAVKAATL